MMNQASFRADQVVPLSTRAWICAVWLKVIGPVYALAVGDRTLTAAIVPEGDPPGVVDIVYWNCVLLSTVIRKSPLKVAAAAPTMRTRVPLGVAVGRGRGDRGRGAAKGDAGNRHVDPLRGNGRVRRIELGARPG